MKIEMPWTLAKRRFETMLTHFQSLHDAVDVVRCKLNDRREPLPPVLPPAFVSVLVVGDGPSGRTTLGDTMRIDGDSYRSITLKSFWRLTNVAVIVFCDLERVEVRQIILGIQPVTAAAGSCAIAYFPEWIVGLDLQVHCRRLDR